MKERGSIQAALEHDEAEARIRAAKPTGTISRLAMGCSTEASNLLGFVLDMSYDEATIVTCDAWKRKCGGVPKNSFVIIRLSPAAAQLPVEETPRPALILARVIEAVGTPLSNEIQQTIFSIHKVQAAIDPYTNAELQWSALKVSILGTYYDDDDGRIAFGNDIDSYMSPHFYEVYVPEPQDLEVLVNSFVSRYDPVTIGELRYTETQTTKPPHPIPVKVSPHDFVANRTALFGKTRMGKSNTIKVIADMMLRSNEQVGQVIFDLNGEYSNVNEQDNTSLFDLHRNRCVRYSFNPQSGKVPGVPDPLPLRVNFYQQVELGHTIFTSLFKAQNPTPPNYIQPLLDWNPVDEERLEEQFPKEAHGPRTRYERARSMYFAVLAKAGFKSPSHLVVPLCIHKDLRKRLAQRETLQEAVHVEKGPSGDIVEVSEMQPVQMAILVYEELFRLYAAEKDDTKLFPPSKETGEPYFGEIHQCLLRMLGDISVSGTKYLIPFNVYHDPAGIHVVKSIVKEVNGGRTVIIDLANADEVLAGYYSRLVCTEVFREQMGKFTAGTLGVHSVLFYFEEAHNLFNRDDRDLRSIYNRLAKEGAKLRIGMVYATQSMTTLSPDLLKNTENFFIAHLNDDREIAELTKKYEFRDIGLDVQRCKTKGYVRMITLSHRYALPVQIRKFERPPVQA